jgi:hypothetical protein
VIALARASKQRSPLYVAHNLHVFRCEVMGEAAFALAHAREAVGRTVDPVARIMAYHGLGIANALKTACGRTRLKVWTRR